MKSPPTIKGPDFSDNILLKIILSTYPKIIIRSYRGLAPRKGEREGETHKETHGGTHGAIYRRTHGGIYGGTHGGTHRERDSRRNTEGYMESL